MPATDSRQPDLKRAAAGASAAAVGIAPTRARIFFSGSPTGLLSATRACNVRHVRAAQRPSSGFCEITAQVQAQYNRAVVSTKRKRAAASAGIGTQGSHLGSSVGEAQPKLYEERPDEYRPVAGQSAPGQIRGGKRRK